MILTLVRARRPAIIVRPKREDDEVEQLCRSLQIATRRDIDGTVTTVIRTMLSEYPKQPVGSSQLASITHINRVTIIHHLKRLQNAGIVQKDERKYRLSPQGFSEFVRRMHEQTEEMFEEAIELAQKIDEQYMLQNSGHARGPKKQVKIKDSD